MTPLKLRPRWLNWKLVIGAVLATGMGTCLAPRCQTIRPISLRVVDAADRAPIAGAPVHRIIETWDYEFPWLIDPNFEIHYRVNESVTDANGQVDLSLVRLLLASHEYVQHEWVLVNLDVCRAATADEWEREHYPDLKTEHGRLARLFSVHDWRHVDDFFNPLAGLRGFVAANVDWSWPDDAAQGGAVRRKFDVLWNSESLRREREVLTVALRRSSSCSACHVDRGACR
jgi:hypothetical protein